MPDSSQIRAGRAFVEIGGNNAGLVKVLDQTAQRFQRFGANIKTIGLQIGSAGLAFSAPLTAAATAFADRGDQIRRSMEKTGLSSEAFTGLSYAAQQTGADADSLAPAFAKMSRTLVEAAQGSKEANTALQMVGTSVSALNNLSQDDRLKAIASGIANIQDPALKATAAMAVFGKGGAELLPLLNQGGQGIAAMEARARALGLEWSGPEVTSAAKFSNALKTLWDVIGRGSEVIGASLAPQLTQLSEAISNNVVKVNGWIKAHGNFVRTASATGAALIGGGVGLYALGTAIDLTGRALGELGSIASTVGSIAGPALSAPFSAAFSILSGGANGVVDVFKGLVSVGQSVIALPATIAAGIASITSSLALIPLAALGAGVLALSATVVGLGIYLLDGSKIATSAFEAIGNASDSALGAARNALGGMETAASSTTNFLGRAATNIKNYFAKLWPQIKTDAVDAFQGIQDALAGGDWTTAGKILWLSLKLAANQSVSDYWKPLLTGFYTAKFELVEAWITTVAAIKDAWSYGVEYLSNFDGIKSAFENLWGYIQKGWNLLSEQIGLFWEHQATKANAEYAVRTTYADRQLTRQDADLLAAPEVKKRTEYLQNKYPGAVGTDAMAAVLKDETEGILKKYRDKYAGQTLTEEDLKQLIELRVTEDSGGTFQEKLDNIKKQSDANTPPVDNAKAAEAARLKIQQEKDARNTANQKELTDSLAKIDPTNAAEIKKLQDQIAALRKQAADEKAKAPASNTSAGKMTPLVSDDLTNTLNQIGLGKGITKAMGAFNLNNQTLTREIFGGDDSDDVRKQTALLQNLVNIGNRIVQKTGPMRAT